MGFSMEVCCTGVVPVAVPVVRGVPVWLNAGTW